MGPLPEYPQKPPKLILHLKLQVAGAFSGANLNCELRHLCGILPDVTRGVFWMRFEKQNLLQC